MSEIPSELQNVLVDCAKTILPQVYSDLAQPGVKAVGQALGTVLEFSSTVLLPLKLVNEKAKLLFVKRLNEYKEKLESIPEGKRIEVAPELGAPVLDKLTYTTNDEIAELFTNLLTNASNENRVNVAHPSFVSMIERLSPDEARILKYLQNVDEILYCDFNGNVEKGYQVICKHVTNIQKKVSLLYPSNELAYLSNLESMGILKDNFGVHKVNESLYDEIASFHAIETLRKMLVPNQYKSITLNKCYYSVTAFGKMFIEACIRT
ncbi:MULTISPECIES: DUF4393 domain-containing protein [unclassified Fibrobacter]|uniref:DUF4393 domain-containing protein n=1 Tax=unclassified Fibrobacter TaxID=2634177 RepID=UPI00091BAB59|nr:MULTISPECIES: DUF4393 domain-containing protein [unclassified Fibrobacter]OWV03289.1 hypothetical protein B7993_13480 [Fibrobacter sp. UWH3]SHL65620.1 protein of unknown function [Fibrobacter sp. UWH6]